MKGGEELCQKEEGNLKRCASENEKISEQLIAWKYLHAPVLFLLPDLRHF